MKLDQDCVRDLLLVFEEHLGLNDRPFVSKFVPTHLEDRYDQEKILYTTLMLYESGLISGRTINVDGGVYDFVIFSLTPEGHAFIDNVRDPKIWAKTKNAVSGIAGVSLPVVAQLAQQLVKEKLGLA
ncbi:DUF2513 domain-containing protein [Planococcus dechangensis]|uniref:DUF2513 domain-containing protein n=1 Tax=Planococcus dechangensis TaxID=1176255 RepID=A0ABV9M8X8_9BACL